MWDQKNLLHTPNLKDLLMCDQSNLKDQFVTNLKLKGPLV